ncbi:MAG TPA: hypothetical protein VGC42_01250 [Kofleriaceae bacterium]
MQPLKVLAGDDDADDDDDGLDEASRAELDRELALSLAEADAGLLIDFDDLMAHLRAISAGPNDAKGGA